MQSDVVVSAYNVLTIQGSSLHYDVLYIEGTHMKVRLQFLDL